MADIPGSAADLPLAASGTTATNSLSNSAIQLQHSFSDGTVTEGAEGQSLDDLRKDVKYKRFVQAVDKILQSFDSVNEWADVIGFLTRLAKIFQAHPQYSIVPRKLIVSKRLAQCLNPALPAGVHQKTLDVYGLILEAAGSAQLAEDLPLWSYGLFPFLQNAAMSVKPIVLNLYEKYYLPLGFRLKPCLKGFILALLPVLEEENNEYFERGLGIMDRLSDTVGQGYFFHCIWLALITVPHLRLAGLHYLLKRMPTVSSREDVAVILGNETGLLAAALSATLEDKAVLVQRGALELLVQHFPLEYRLFKDDDLEAVIRSAVSVVSRRDMSLNRRLYSWLLGNTEENEKEKAAETPKHEKEIVMLLDNQEAVTNALRTMFLAGSNEAGDLTKPYKILISLMDKPEIGQTVLERLFFDILWSLREHCEKTDQKTELLQTAKMFFDMLDPFIVWKQVFHVVQRNDINDPESAEAYELLCYTLEHMRFNDDESQRVHIPYLLHTITSEITAVIGSELTPLPPTLNSSLILCADLLNGIATEAYETTWRLGDFVGENDGLPKLTIDTGREAKKDLVLKPGVLEEQIREFYGPEGSGQIRDDPFVVHKDFRAGQVVIDGAFVQLRRLLELFITEGVFGGEAVGGELFRIADVTGYMVGRLAEHMDAIGTKLRLEWATAARNGEAVETPDWITALLRGATESDVFGVVRMCIRCLLSAFRSPRYPIPLPKDYGAYNERTIRKLWKFLAPEDLAYHEEVTTLIWESTDVTSTYAVENVLSRLLGEESGKKRMVAMERFGVFWRFSEEKGKATSIAFSRPLFLVLDAIRSDDFAMQRAGEGWIRSFVRDQNKLLDPLLSILLHRDISRKSATVRISGEDVPLLYYTSPFNLGQVEYAFANLAALVKVGDRGFLRRAWGGAVQVVAGIQVHGEDEDKMTYGDLLLDLGIRYLETEPSPHRAQLFAPRKMDAIHSRVCDFVQQFVVRSEKGQISSKVLTEMQDVLIRKLLFCIFSAKVDLQEKLLGLWKTTLAVGGISQGAAGREEKKDGKETAKLSIFIRTILEALSLKSNRPVLQSWIDFILFALPHFRTSVTTVLWPIIRCICEEIRKYQSSLSRYIRSFSRTSGSSEGFLGSSAVGDGKVDSEAPILLIALERIFAFCLENGLNSANGNRTNNGAGGDNSGLRALTGYVSSVVFGENERSDPEEELAQKKVREAVLMMTPGVLRVLEELYAVVYDLGAAFEGIGREVRDGCVRCLEVVYANYPVDALESVAEVWFAECGGVPDDQHAKLNNVTIRMIHAVPGCSQIDIVNMVVDSLRSRAAVSQGLPLKDKGRKLLRSPTLPDASLMLFLEKYCQRWADVQTVEDTWSSVLAYVRDSFVAPGAYKFMFPSMLRLMTVYFEKLIGRPAFEDRRVRREAEDAYQKVCDSCILIGGRAFEKGTWSGRAVPAVDVEGAAAEDAGGDFGGLAVLPEIAGTLKRASKLSEDTLMQEVIMYIATSVFPSLRKFLTEQDRVLALFTNAIYYIVGPNLKNRQNVRLLLTPILELICAMTKVPFGYKAWRKEAWEAFMDPRFFQMGLAAERKWRVIVQSEITNEKERIGELIGRISAAASSTLFVSKDQEALNRAHAVRRLSFAVFCGTRDQYVPQLPAIQEKLVDILKVSGGGVMHCEVFLCLRVLLRRISPKHLANIWPTVLSELIRLFGVYLRSQDGDKSEDLAVFFAACKFLDLLLVLGIEDFQWHQWIFITETLELLHDLVTAQVRSVALVDKLSYKWTGGASSSTLSKYIAVTATPAVEHDNPIKVADGAAPLQRLLPDHKRAPFGTATTRPLLTMRSIHDRKQLEPFVQSISGYMYQTTYSVGKPDIDFIESMLESDFLEVEDAALGGGAGAAGSTGGVAIPLSPSPRRTGVVSPIPTRSSMDSIGGSPQRGGTPPVGLRGKGMVGRPFRVGSVGSAAGSDTEWASDPEGKAK